MNPRYQNALEPRSRSIKFMSFSIKNKKPGRHWSCGSAGVYLTDTLEMLLASLRRTVYGQSRVDLPAVKTARF